VRTYLRDGQWVHEFHWEDILIDRRIDIHYHDAWHGDSPAAVRGRQRGPNGLLTVAVKWAGDTAAYMFSNESYANPGDGSWPRMWARPEWAIPAGDTWLTVTVYYESGLAIGKVRIANNGQSLDAFKLSHIRSRV
jgi:hypothetical protein